MSNEDPNTQVVYQKHRYRITFVPDGCKDPKEGDFVTLYVPNPPSNSVVLDNGGRCNGITAVLDEP